MFTIRIKTRGTKKFSWNSSAARSFAERATTSLREAVVAAIEDCRDYLSGDGAHDGVEAALVTWEDDDELHAFLFPLTGAARRWTDVPAELPWVLMRTKPERVTRESP